MPTCILQIYNSSAPNKELDDIQRSKEKVKTMCVSFLYSMKRYLFLTHAYNIHTYFPQWKFINILLLLILLYSFNEYIQLWH